MRIFSPPTTTTVDLAMLSKNQLKKQRKRERLAESQRVEEERVERERLERERLDLERREEERMEEMRAAQQALIDEEMEEEERAEEERAARAEEEAARAEDEARRREREPSMSAEELAAMQQEAEYDLWLIANPDVAWQLEMEEMARLDREKEQRGEGAQGMFAWSEVGVALTYRSSEEAQGCAYAGVD